jgi:hypothetical protein
MWKIEDGGGCQTEVVKPQLPGKIAMPFQRQTLHPFPPFEDVVPFNRMSEIQYGGSRQTGSS